MSTAQKVKELIANNKVMVFSKSYCGFCASVKSKLQSIGVTPTVVELDVVSDGAAMQAELLALTGQRTVPNVFVNGRHIGGNDVTTQKINDGSLQQLLQGTEL